MLNLTYSVVRLSRLWERLSSLATLSSSWSLVAVNRARSFDSTLASRLAAFFPSPPTTHTAAVRPLFADPCARIRRFLFADTPLRRRWRPQLASIRLSARTHLAFHRSLWTRWSRNCIQRYGTRGGPNCLDRSISKIIRMRQARATLRLWLLP